MAKQSRDNSESLGEIIKFTFQELDETMSLN